MRMSLFPKWKLVTEFKFSRLTCTVLSPCTALHIYMCIMHVDCQWSQFTDHPERQWDRATGRILL